MEYRSANPGQHISNDIVAGVGSSHGVQIGGASTGGVVQSVGDDANISLNLVAKGTAAVRVGTSSNTVEFAGSAAGFGGFVRATDTAVSTPGAFNDTTAGRVAESTHTIAGVNSSYLVIAQSNNLPAGIVITNARAGSSAGEIKVSYAKGSTVAVAGTTCTVTFLAFKF